ncbi:MAG: hydrogenase/urease maturation nickel metallochaperone HypA [Proteobacteria bacterium]|nr:hydrogenase/urease maturation nickel metallochaperone HypA [Pseudomonadota bacterium]
MHEATIARYAFDIINETIDNLSNLKGKKVKKIVFGNGKPYTVMVESFELYFSELVKGTRLEGAILEYERSEQIGFFVSTIEVEE